MGLGKWVDSATARSPAAALELLRSVPGGPFLPVPWRFIDRQDVKDRLPGDVIRANDYLNRLIDQAPLADVPVGSLTAIQHTCRRAQVEGYLLQPTKLRRLKQRDNRHGGLVDYPIVIKSQGLHRLWDGHHRSYATMLLGCRLIKVRLADLDAALSGK